MTQRPYITIQNADSLVDGVPDYMANSLDPWLEIMLTKQAYSGSDRRVVNEGIIRWLERKLRRDLGSTASQNSILSQTMYYLRMNADLKLDVVSALLEEYGNAKNIDILEIILNEAGSKWTVKQNDREIYCLEERVEALTTESYEMLVSQDDIMSGYLKNSWNEIFGLNPNPSRSYADSIKALEAALWPKVLPNNNRATLGDIIRELDSNNNQYITSISERSNGLEIKNIVGQLKLIWQGQTDRHGTSNPVEPSKQAAEQALFITLSICQLFARELVRKSS